MDESDAGAGGPTVAPTASPPAVTISATATGNTASPLAGTHVAAAAASLKARSGGRRRSCNRCSAKKERCDGQEPCQRCTKSGLACQYATCRTLGRPRNNAASSPAPATDANSAPAASRNNTSSSNIENSDASSSVTKRRQKSTHSGEGLGKSSTVADPGTRGGKTQATTVGRDASAQNRVGGGSGGGGRKRTKDKEAAGGAGGDAATGLRSAHKTSSRTAAGNKKTPLKLKRACLSPSPATGLVGLVQNQFLTCFIKDFSSLYSIVDDTVVRAGLINLMSGKIDAATLSSMSSTMDYPPVPSASKRAAREVDALGGGSGDGQSKRGGSLVARPAQATVAARRAVSREDYAINSTIFSAMALGALLLGQLPTSVEEYASVAEASLRLLEPSGRPVVNPHVAKAHLLLALCSNVAGRPDYPARIQVARECYEKLRVRGVPTPRPIADVLAYRTIMDALGSKQTSTRIPAPRDTSGGRAANVDASAAAAPTSPGYASRVPTSSRTRDEANAVGSPEVARLSSRLCPLGTGPGGGRSGDDSSQGDGNAMVEGRQGLPPLPLPPPPRCGIEAARERSRLKVADSLSMVSDIMTVLSTVPWSMKTEDGARRCKETLLELRTLVVAEKALAEERRAARYYKEMPPSEAMAVYALGNAFIGLHCGLQEFSELLRHARDVARCIADCPGLARYQLHGYHTALTVLRAFGKRDEYLTLVAAAPVELRRSTVTNKPLHFDSEGDLCSRQVCVKHCNAITGLGKLYAKNNSSRHATSTMSTISTCASPPQGEAASRQRRGSNISPTSAAALTSLTKPDQLPLSPQSPSALSEGLLLGPIKTGPRCSESSDLEVGPEKAGHDSMDASEQSPRVARRMPISLPREMTGEQQAPSSATVTAVAMRGASRSAVDGTDDPSGASGRLSPLSSMSCSGEMNKVIDSSSPDSSHDSRRQGLQHPRQPPQQQQLREEQQQQQQMLPPYSYLLMQPPEAKNIDGGAGGDDLSISTVKVEPMAAAAGARRSGGGGAPQQMIPFPEAWRQRHGQARSLQKESSVSGDRRGLVGGVLKMNGSGGGGGGGGGNTTGVVPGLLLPSLRIQDVGDPSTAWGTEGSTFSDTQLNPKTVGWTSPSVTMNVQGGGGSGGSGGSGPCAGSGSQLCFSALPYRQELSATAEYREFCGAAAQQFKTMVQADGVSVVGGGGGSDGAAAAEERPRPTYDAVTAAPSFSSGELPGADILLAQSWAVAPSSPRVSLVAGAVSGGTRDSAFLPQLQTGSRGVLPPSWHRAAQSRRPSSSAAQRVLLGGVAAAAEPAPQHPPSATTPPTLQHHPVLQHGARPLATTVYPTPLAATPAGVHRDVDGRPWCDQASLSEGGVDLSAAAGATAASEPVPVSRTGSVGVREAERSMSAVGGGGRGDGGQEDSMLRDLWELMDNVDAS